MVPKAPRALELDVLDLQISFRDSGGGTLRIVDLPHWHLGAGSFAVITGPSGAGKSTLLYALAGLISSDSGAIRWGGTNISHLGERARDRFRRHHFGFVFQDFHLIQEMSPLDNALLPAWFENFRAPADLRDRAQALLEQFAVPTARRRVLDLSRGEQQRVALARALLFDPPIILADEPTASLDEAASSRILDDLSELAASAGRTIIAVSHDPRLIERAPVRLHMEHGHMAAAGAVQV
ncbi:ABC transporter ATP-binding protein [Microvirga sp. VF16]|uniref:ABC transporter ATP-binding protein n=1 Tax=Microvirga sp. VF16 TaxID=2807101 RepID=UPI00193CE9E4|nr:ATP-binding cassette domain-containing protein [Microvirga sp. VF16]QRM34357.1 ATP-binding cassette domain-containing protein [Microvirga sp. VF16]